MNNFRKKKTNKKRRIKDYNKLNNNKYYKMHRFITLEMKIISYFKFNKIIKKNFLYKNTIEFKKIILRSINSKLN